MYFFLMGLSLAQTPPPAPKGAFEPQTNPDGSPATPPPNDPNNPSGSPQDQPVPPGSPTADGVTTPAPNAGITGAAAGATPPVDGAANPDGSLPPLEGETRPSNPPVGGSTDAGEIRPAVVRVEDALQQFHGTPVITLQQGETVSTLTVADNGETGDAVAGDHVWSTVTGVSTGQPVNVALYADQVAGTPVKSGTVTFADDGSALQLVFRVDDNTIDISTESAVPATNAPPTATPGKPGLPNPPANAPAGPSTLGNLSSSSSPYQMGLYLLGGLGVLMLLRQAFVGFWQGRQLLAPPTLPLMPFGHALTGVEIWVVPAEHAETLARKTAEQLALWTQVLWLGRPNAQQSPSTGHIWRLKKAQPDPGKVLSALSHTRAGVLVLEGPGALEAPLSDEGPAEVMDELLKGLKRPTIIILRPDEPHPKGEFTVRTWEVGEGALTTAGRQVAL